MANLIAQFMEDTVPCALCKIDAPTKMVSFHQNIGMLVTRQERELKGELCRRCSKSTFLSYTLTTLFLGWWGIISFCVTPFMILGNIFSYVRCLSLPEPTISAMNVPMALHDVSTGATRGLTFKIIYGTIVWGVIGVLGVQGLQRSAQPQTKVADAQPVTDAKSYITIDSSWSSLKTKGSVIGGWTRVHWSGGTPLTSPNNFALLCTDRDDCFKLPKGGTFEARLVDNPNLKYTGDLTLEVDLKDGKLGRYQVSKLDDSELQVDEEVISPDRHYLLFKVHWADGADAGQSFHLYCNRFLPDCRSLNVGSYYIETLATDDETTYQDLSYKIYNRKNPKDFGVYGSGILGSVTPTPQEK